MRRLASSASSLPAVSLSRREKPRDVSGARALLNAAFPRSVITVQELSSAVAKAAGGHDGHVVHTDVPLQLKYKLSC